MLSPVFDPVHMLSATLDVMAGSHAPPSWLAARQQERLSRLLQTACAHSGLYRERAGSRLLGPADWKSLAPVTRAELMARFEEWVTDPALKLDELRAFTADPARIAEPWLGKYMVWESSGTSGLPGIFIQDARALAVYDSLEALRHRVPARSASVFGAFALPDLLSMGDRYALVTATGGHFASVCSLERLRRVNPWVGSQLRGFSLLQPVASLVQALNEYKPSILATYPSAAAMLAEESEQGRLRIRPRCVMTGGETLSLAARSRIAEVFEAHVRDSYGASEFFPMAWECAHGHLHLNEDWLVLEPVDEHYRPVPRGELSYTVLLTNLANHVQPLIRYDLGDQVNLHTGRCGCGSALPVIEVKGRSDDTMRVPGRVRGQFVSLLPLALCTLLEEECGVFDFQIQQREPSTLVLRLPSAGPEGQAALERCRAALQTFAASQGAKPIQVTGELGCTMPRGRSGKACRVMLESAAPREPL